jgi:hypothetical protein
VLQNVRKYKFQKNKQNILNNFHSYVWLRLAHGHLVAETSSRISISHYKLIVFKVIDDYFVIHATQRHVQGKKVNRLYSAGINKNQCGMHTRAFLNHVCQPLLKNMTSLLCTVIDYSKTVNQKGKVRPGP